jgi:hypothetical protein
MSDVRANAADVRDAAGRLEEIRLWSAAARLKRRADVIGQRPMVVNRVIAAERELEAGFPFLAPWQFRRCSPCGRAAAERKTKLTGCGDFTPPTVTGTFTDWLP